MIWVVIEFLFRFTILCSFLDRSTSYLNFITAYIVVPYIYLGG